MFQINGGILASFEMFQSPLCTVAYRTGLEICMEALRGAPLSGYSVLIAGSLHVVLALRNFGSMCLLNAELRIREDPFEISRLYLT